MNAINEPSQQAPSTKISQIKSLRGQLPPLHFDPLIDSKVFTTSEGRAYQEFYPLRCAEHIRRGLGALNLQGFSIAIHYFIPESATTTLVVAHGLYDHIGIYHQAIRWALEAGIAVVAFDLPGHGLSDGDEVAIDSFNIYTDILADVINAVLAQPLLFPTPVNGLGQSTGSAIWLNLLWRHPEVAAKVQKYCLLAPLVRPRGWYIGRLSYRLVRPFRQYIARGQSRSSHNAIMLDFINRQDPLQSKLLSLRWIGAMAEFASKFVSFTPRDNKVLIIQGTHDQTLAWRYNVKIIKEKLPNAQIAYIAGADHQLLNEDDEYLAQVRLLMADYLAG